MCIKHRHTTLTNYLTAKMCIKHEKDNITSRDQTRTLCWCLRSEMEQGGVSSRYHPCVSVVCNKTPTSQTLNSEALRILNLSP